MAKGLPKKMPEADPCVLIERLATKQIPVQDIADLFGFSLPTLYARFKDEPAFGLAYKRGSAKGREIIVNKLWQLLNCGDLNIESRMCIFALKTRCGWREKDRPEEEQESGDEIGGEFANGNF